MNRLADIRPRANAVTGSQDRKILRILTCGSVDDGKSTLIGRMFADLGLIPDDQLRALARDSKDFGTNGEEIDYALFLDGLEAEQEQGITIDVAFRYFEYQGRSFIVADTPGHEQYTQNMATGASVSDLAIILIDARKGILPQTRRHSIIVSNFGIRHVVLAVNKFDLVDYSEQTFRMIERDYRAFAATLGLEAITAIPIAARHGDNIVQRSARMPWYAGPVLFDVLSTAEPSKVAEAKGARFLVQRVVRTAEGGRALAGLVTQGILRSGAAVSIAGSRHSTVVIGFLDASIDIREVRAGGAATIMLADEVDVARGDVLFGEGAALHFADQFAGQLLWFSEEPMIPGRSYFMKIGARTVGATVTELKHRIDINTGAPLAAKQLQRNEFGFCNFALAMPVPFDDFRHSQAHGGLILIDRLTNQTVGAGTISFELRRAQNLHPTEMRVSKAVRTTLKGHRPAVLWMTGLSGAGKSTIANIVDAKLNALGCHTFMLDGDNVRMRLNRDLGFTEADRVENVRRVGEVARLFADAGLIVIVALISPYRSERLAVRQNIDDGEFIEIFVDAPIDVCRTRDPKGLYARAARGELKNFTGVDAPYEPPQSPEIHLESTGDHAAADLADQVVAFLRSKSIVS